MVEEAERYKEEDEQARLRVEAKNQLEAQCYQLKEALSNEKISEENRTEISALITKTLEECENPDLQTASCWQIR